MVNFRKHHILQLLRQFENQIIPFDSFINSYFRAHKALGSKDRAEIADISFGMIRYKEALDHIVRGHPDIERKYQAFVDPNFEEYKNNPRLPLHIKASQPKAFYQMLCNQYGDINGHEIAEICNTEAPITIRINPLKTERDTLLAMWKDRYEVIACQYSPLGIQFSKRINFSELDEFQAGLFEVQDEGSQLVSFLVKATPKDKVMDFCAGAGGKTLGFAPNLQNKGLIYLNDIRPLAIQQAKKRLSRAGIFNVHYLPNLETLKGKLDWILVDAPCSGTGTYRRNVDLKWKFSLSMLENVRNDQKTIFADAVKLLRPGGRIVYATCSILREENEMQVEQFLKQHSLKLVEKPFSSLPTLNGMDGFFAATMML